jgi:hypothetical protein
MKVLLDECLPLDFRHSFRSHEAHTVQFAGFKGQKNGALLQAAEIAGYQVFLTVDHGIPQQTSSAGRKLSVVVMRSRTNQLEDLLPLVERILEVLHTIGPGETIYLSESD